jgi:hypothetical protein
MSSNSNEINNQFASLLRWVPVALLLSVLAIGCAPSARADSFTYSYVGNAYNQFGGTFACPPVCGITGSFTVAAPLTPNANYYFTPLSFSFTDGLTVFTPTSVTKSDFGVVTNLLGQIIGWNMDWQIPTDEMFSGTNPPGCVGCRVVDGSFDGNIAFAEINDTPGKWSASSSVPEPSSIVMLCTGLLGLLGARRRRLTKSSETCVV